MQDKIAVIGGGSWGTGIAQLLGNKDNNVTLYVLEKEVCEQINDRHENTEYLPGAPLSDNVTAETFDKINKIDTDKVVWVVPTQFSRSTAEKYKEALQGKDILIATKGIEISTGKLVVEMMKEVLDAKYSILSGPSFAKEVADARPTAVSIASADLDSAEFWQHALSTGTFRCYVTDDIVGVEVGGAMKNVIALATGISDGLNFGHNARAGLITRGLAEITRLGMAMGANAETFMGLSGMGDLVLTCTGDLSRNRQVGFKIAEGNTIDDITNKMNMVAEGVYTAKAAYELAKKMNIEMPITDEVYRIIYENKKPYDSVLDLMRRPLKNEQI